MKHLTEMYVTETKRATYDEQGRMYKLDILHSIRKNGALPTIMHQPDHPNSHSGQDKRERKSQTANQSLKMLEILLVFALIIAMIILCKSVYNRRKSQPVEILEINSINNSQQQTQIDHQQQIHSKQEQSVIENASLNKFANYLSQQSSTNSEQKTVEEYLKKSEMNSLEKEELKQIFLSKLQCRVHHKTSKQMICEMYLSG